MLLLSMGLRSQSIALKHYNSRNSALGQNQVIMINRANDGSLLLSTYGGMSRFNGKRFFNYTKKQGLQSNVVFGTMDRSDTLWVASRDGIDLIVNDKIVNFYSSPSFGMYYSRFYSYKDLFFLRDINMPQNNMGKNTSYFFDINKKKLVNKVFVEDSLTIMHTAAFCKDSVLVWTSVGLVVASLIDFKARHKNIPEIDASHTVLDSRGDYLALGDGNGIVDSVRKLIKFNVSTGFKIDSVYDSGDGLLPQIGQIFIFRDNMPLLILDKNLNLFQVEKGRNKKLATLSGSPHNNYLDKDYWWQGTDNGFFKLEIPGFKYYRATDSFPADVWSVLPDSSGRIWFAGYNNMDVKIFDGEKLLQTDEKLFRMFHNSPVIGFNNEMLFPSHTGLSVYEQSGKYVKEIALEKPTLNLALDHKREIVLASSMDLLYQIDSHYQAKMVFQTNEIGPYQSILSVLPYQHLYYLAMSKGFAAYDPDADSARLLTANTFRVSDLVADTAETIWLATDQGLFAYRDDSLVQVLPNLIQENLLTIDLTNDNRLVIAGSSSLYTIELNKYYRDIPHFLLTYRESAGYEPVEPGQNSFYKDNNGHLWLPTVEYVVKIETEKLLIPEKLPKAEMLEAIAINNSFTDTLLFYDTAQIVVSSNFNNLEFAFEAVDLDFPESLRFEYMLEGRSSNWIPLLDEYKLHFDNLKPGQYSLQVRATRSESFEQVPIASIKLVVLYPLWLKWWFVTITLISLMGLLFFIVILFLKRQRKKQQNQIELARLRSLALSVQMDHHFLTNNIAKIALLNEKGLNQQASEFSFLLVRFLQKNMHFLRKEMVALQEELELIQAWVALVQGNSRKIDLDINLHNDIDAGHILILPFLIQPVIENAIKHGAKPNTEDPLKINVIINCEDNLLSVSVVNKLPELELSPIGGNHLSLKIIEERLQIIGGRSEIVVNKMPNSFQCLIILDLRKM